MVDKYNLLFAEDTVAPHRAIDKVVKDYNNISVIHVSTGEKALDRIEQKDISILITDNNFHMAGGLIWGLN